ncbi:MAG: hypothetical protein GF387_01145 [Candidatus Portnoybacteria bacterium]|nr:hypothetical protein [Candidatus Portnoybacteria bacterium]
MFSQRISPKTFRDNKKQGQRPQILVAGSADYIKFFHTCGKPSAERERELKENFSEKKGLPIGNLTSQIFANIFLDKFDWFIKKQLRIKHYFRYADDFAIIDQDPKYLESLIILIQEFLNSKLDLKLHLQKVEIRKLSQGVDFLGYVILPYYIILRTKTKKRMFRKIKEHKLKLNQDLISRDSFE